MTDKIEMTEDMLKMMADNLPTFPPLSPGGDLSIKDMLPNLTDEELDQVAGFYQGTMRKE